MERHVYEVVIRRTETCHVRVMAVSESEAVEAALREEASGRVLNYIYSDECVEAEKVD